MDGKETLQLRAGNEKKSVRNWSVISSSIIRQSPSLASNMAAVTCTHIKEANKELHLCI